MQLVSVGESVSPLRDQKRGTNCRRLRTSHWQKNWKSCYMFTVFYHAVVPPRWIFWFLKHWIHWGFVLLSRKFLLVRCCVVKKWAEIMYHLFADDMQGHEYSQPQNAAMIVASLEDCVIAVSKWCASKRFQMNAKKTELLPMVWIGAELRKVDPSPEMSHCRHRCHPTSRRGPGSRSLLQFASPVENTRGPELPGPASSIFVVYLKDVDS